MIKATLTENRSDKKTRINITTTQDTHFKLKKLSRSCNMSKTALAEELLRMSVNHPDIINFYQEQYNTEEQYRVYPIRGQNGEIYY